MTEYSGGTASWGAAPFSRPPAWLIVSTGVLAVACLAMAVAETTLWLHYFIDAGEYVSLAGLVFILVAGVVLFRRQRLFVSLPLVLPWLLYPVITQGDEIIDNLSINPMRAICQVLLAAIFGTPVAVIVMGARYALAPKPGEARGARAWTAFVPGLRPIAQGRVREGTIVLATALLTAEIWIAHQFLGTLMVATLIIMILMVLGYGSLAPDSSAAVLRRRGERFALVVLVAGVMSSFGLYVAYKNRPGAYQGSPSAFMDPGQVDVGYRLDRIAVPSSPPSMPASADLVRDALSAYGRTLEELLAGYYILDRNYTYDFHNELFLRRTPLLPDYRAVALQRIERARVLRSEADARAVAARSTLSDGDPLAALLDDLTAFVAFNFDRVPVLERMSAEFQQTKAGLQHAAHLYEGEGKFLSQRVFEIRTKHGSVLDSPTVAPVTAPFGASSRSISDAYANRIVGF